MALIVVFLFAMATSLSGLTNACMCYPWPPDPVEGYCSSDFVLQVEVLSETKTLRNGQVPGPDDLFTENDLTYWYDIKVLKEYKTQSGYDRAVKRIMNRPGHLCGAGYEPGKTYIIMGTLAQRGDQTYLKTSLCGVSVSVADSREYVRDVKKVVTDGVPC